MVELFNLADKLRPNQLPHYSNLLHYKLSQPFTIQVETKIKLTKKLYLCNNQIYISEYLKKIKDDTFLVEYQCKNIYY